MALATDSVTVTVPATSANLGPGFDCAGLALDLRDEITFDALATREVIIDITGEGASSLPRDEKHLVVKAFRQASEVFDVPEFGLHLTAHNVIPQSRGMGSSAEAIVAGVSAAAAFGGYDVDSAEVRDAIFDISATIEGHPDNVAPAVYGGLTCSWAFDSREVNDEDSDLSHFPGDAVQFSSGYHTVKYPVSANINAFIFIPDYELSTQEARGVLPQNVTYTQALKNVSRVALLPAALGRASSQTANAMLFSATADTLHQDYRGPLMQPSCNLMRLMRSHGYASTISGAGPCVLVLHAGDDHGEVEKLAFESISYQHWRMLHLPIDKKGVLVTSAK